VFRFLDRASPKARRPSMVRKGRYRPSGKIHAQTMD
jgi:hypothetical protein